MKKTVLLFLLNLILSDSYSVTFQRIENFMGSAFVIAFVDSDYIVAEKKYQQVKAEIIRIEKLISSWDKNSETSKINRNAGIKPVIVSKELFFLIERSKKISELTDGYFDISYASFDRIWKFDGTVKLFPDSQQVRQILALVNYKNIILNKDSFSVYLKKKGMKIGFGAIGKGYAANRCKKLLTDLGIHNGLISAGGDIITWGRDENNEKWKIAVTNPNNKMKDIANFDISDKAVVTSGNYEKFIEIDNVKYSHIINPKTGWPALGVKSVTVFCPDAEIADALATSVFVMGAEKGTELINKLKNIDVFIVDNNDKKIVSDNIKIDN